MRGNADELLFRRRELLTSTALEQMADGLAGALAPRQNALKVAIALLPTRTIDHELCARL